MIRRRKPRPDLTAGFAFPKGSRSVERAIDHQLEVDQIASTRQGVWRRSSRCEMCGDFPHQSWQRWGRAEHEMNEDPSRAKTKGRPPEERFNPHICWRLCCECHRLFTAGLKRTQPLTERGALGAYEIQDRDPITREWVTVRTIDRARGLWW